jgi:hypothetical protein
MGGGGKEQNSGQDGDDQSRREAVGHVELRSLCGFLRSEEARIE